MNVSHISQSTGITRIARPVHEVQREAKSVDTLSRTEETSARTSPLVALPTDNNLLTSESEQDKGSGVLRLLEEGHFKGVADVRLRINFFDELAERAALTAEPVAETQSATLRDTVLAGIDKIIAALDVDDATKEGIAEAVSGFEAALQDTLTAIKSGDGIAGFADSVQTIFDTLMTQLADLLRPTEPITDSDVVADGDVTDPPSAESTVADTTASIINTLASVVDTIADTVDDAVAIDGTTDETPTDGASSPTATPTEATDEPTPTDATTVFEDALAVLKAAFDEALTQLRTSITDVTTLSDPSEPTGNGGAFEKFLAIYNELRGISPTVDEQA